MRRGRLSAFLVALAVTASLLGVRAESATFVVAAEAPVCTSSAVCVTASDRPDAVSATSAMTVRDVGQDSSLTNNSGNKLSQVEFTEAIPEGFGVRHGRPGCVHGGVGDGDLSPRPGGGRSDGVEHARV